MERVAIIDLGTNTFNLLIVEAKSDGTYKKLFQTKFVVKLGEGAINKGYIAPTPFQRGLDAISKHKETIEKYGVIKTLAIATSAIRDADNGSDFVKQIKENTGIEIQVISGDEEAELIYYGVKNGLALTTSPSLIIDIGGGSTEFIIANFRTIFWKKSFPLGASRLLQRTQPSEPITKTEIDSLTNFLEEELTSLFDALQEFPVKEIIGSSGAFDSLAEIIAMKYYTIDRIKGKTEYEFRLTDFEKTYEQVIKSTTEERLKIKGLVPMRVDMIVVSCILLNFIIQRTGIKTMRSSTYSLKEGAIFKLLNT